MTTRPLKPLRGVRVLSLALNLPGPAALMRLRSLGATCVKAEPPGRAGGGGDPMREYNPAVYATLHEGVRVLTVDLKSDKGQAVLRRELARTDVLLTSFRPSALNKLGLSWRALHRAFPGLSMVAIVGSPGARAEEPGHDLTYLAEAGLITGSDLPPTLFADMAGALMAADAVLQAVLLARASGKGVFQEVALSDAAVWLALPRTWGLTLPTDTLGGAHAGYRIYACHDGRATVAAIEPHFAAALCAAAGVEMADKRTMFAPATHRAIETFMAARTRAQLDRLALERDIPLHTLA